MAGWASLNVQDTQSVRRWQEKLQNLNAKVARLVEEAQNALAEFKDTAVGNVFMKVVEYSGAVISGMRQILEGMNKILDTVNKLVTDVINKLKELVTGTETKQRQTVG